MSLELSPMAAIGSFVVTYVFLATLRSTEEVAISISEPMVLFLSFVVSVLVAAAWLLSGFSDRTAEYEIVDAEEREQS